MGCVHSRVEKEEAVRRCRERRRLMKHLLSRRAELAVAHMAYLQSLRNTGATLRQFTDVDSMIPGDAAAWLPTSPPPPPPLPPSPPPPPPPPPHFSPEVRKAEAEAEAEKAPDLIDIDDDDDDDGTDDSDDDCCTPPPPPLHNSEWDFWDPFGPPPSSNSSSPLPQKKKGAAPAPAPAPEAVVEEENWAEANTEFTEEEEAEGEGEVSARGANVAINPVKDKSPIREVVDDNSSAVSWLTKDTDMAVVVWRSKKTMAGIVKELDDYFLKAAAGGKDVAVLLESNRGHRLHWNFGETKAKRSKSAKVFSTLSWSWSSRSPLSFRDACTQEASSACRPGNHCTTLEKLYAEEQMLYKEVKDEEITKLQNKKKTLLLHKLEARDHEWSKTEKLRSDIEELQTRIISLQESINGTCLSISKLRDEELRPQLVELSFGLVQMWRTMYECHQVQNHVAQQVSLLDKHPGTEPTTDSHHLATTQLETEANFWYTSFCDLLRSQREYVHVLNQWVRLTDCLPDSNGLTGSASGIHALCEEWQRTLERLPVKVAAEAIKSFVSVIHSIVMQQTEERNLRKRSERLESRLEKEVSSLCESENRNASTAGDSDQLLGSNHHTLVMKHAKLDAFKKRVEDEKAKYLNSVRISRAMTLNNLQTSLPNVFQALMGFASVCMQAFEGLVEPDDAAMDHPEGVLPL